MALYIISAGTRQPTTIDRAKIGYAVDPARRITELQAAHWERLFCIRTMEGDMLTEAAYHAHFSEQRISRDWFWFVPDMLTFTPEATAKARPAAAVVLDKYLRENRCSTTALAAMLGTHQTNVSMWRLGKRVIPAERAAQISSVTGIPRHDLRPDLWPQSGEAAA